MIKNSTMKTMVFFCCIFLFFTGCKKSVVNNLDGKKGTDMFPNKVGDTWLYQVNDTLVNRATNEKQITQYNMTVSVIQSIQLGGAIPANMWVYSSVAGTDTNYVFEAGDTVRFIGNRQYLSPITKQYIIPLQLHSSWPYDQNSFQNVMVDLQENITVQQHDYENAFHIAGYSGMPDGMVFISEWIAPNVGVIKRYSNASGMIIQQFHITGWTLINYHLE
jgi:hypothetical protein